MRVLPLSLCALVAGLLLGSGANAQILVGQTVGITGTVAATVGEADQGAQLVFDAVNAHGGIHGQRIELIRVDDAFDIRRTVENARQLIEDKQVLALFMTRGTPNTQALLPMLDKHEVALVGPSTGAIALHKPVPRHVFNVRATYQREAERAVTHLTSIGLRTFAVVHADDSFGQDALEGAKHGLTAAKLEPTAVVPADRIRPDYAAIVPKVAGAQAVIWIGSGTAVADGIKALRAAGSAAQVVTLSNNAPSGFIKALGDASRGVIVTQVFPSERSVATPMVKDAMTAAKAKGINLSPAALEGYAAAKVLVEGLRRAGPNPTRQSVVAGLNSLRSFDLGGLEISYSPQDHSGIDYADLSIISEGRFKR